MRIEESELRKILAEAFEAGFYGCKDLQENVVDELVSRVKDNESQASVPETITISSGAYDGSAMVMTPWVQHVNPADRRTWNNLPNRNGDVFISSEVPELQINVETTRIEANPNPRISDAIRDMQAQEDARFLASVDELTERARVIERERNNEQNDNPTV